MKKFLCLTLLTVTMIFGFNTYNLHALVVSHNIDVEDTITINDNSSQVIFGEYSYDNSTTSVIYMSVWYSSIEIVINYKSNNVELIYALEVLSGGSWTEVTRINSSDTTGTLGITTAILGGNDYRVKVYNPYNLFGRSSSIDIKWYAIR